MTPEQLAEIEARAAKATESELVYLCVKVARIKADLDEFDGDRRGHLAALEEALEEVLAYTGATDIPSLAAALRAAWERVGVLEGALMPFAHPPLYVFDPGNGRSAGLFVPTKLPDDWVGGGMVSTEDYRAARAALSPEEHKG